MTTLQSRIQRAMKHKEGCDPPALAAACRIKTPSVHGWMNGDTKSMAAGPAIRAAAYLGVNALWLAEGEGPMLPDDGKTPAAPPPELSETHHRPRRKLVARFFDLAESINDIGLKRLLPMVEDAVRMYPFRKPLRKRAKAA